MTMKQALAIIGNRAKWEIIAMERALSTHAWLNTPDENRRLEACKIVLKGTK